MKAGNLYKIYTVVFTILKYTSKKYVHRFVFAEDAPCRFNLDRHGEGIPEDRPVRDKLHVPK